MANTKLVKNLMVQLDAHNLMNGELETFFNNFADLTLTENSGKMQVKTEKKQRPLSEHNVKVRENIKIINLRYKAAAKDVFAIAAMMSRIERTDTACVLCTDTEVSKSIALNKAICEANRKYDRVVIVCPCDNCGNIVTNYTNVLYIT